MDNSTTMMSRIGKSIDRMQISRCLGLGELGGNDEWLLMGEERIPLGGDENVLKLM